MRSVFIGRVEKSWEWQNHMVEWGPVTLIFSIKLYWQNNVGGSELRWTA
jgi:hypothetical protein